MELRVCYLTVKEKKRADDKAGLRFLMDTFPQFSLKSVIIIIASLSQGSQRT